MGAAFGLVGIEQADRRLATDDPLQLPRQTGRVANSGAHPLAQVGRHRVCGVACHQHPSDPPRICDQRSPFVDVGTKQPIGRGEPRRQHLRGLLGPFEIRSIVIRPEHQLEPQAWLGDWHERQRVADATPNEAVTAGKRVVLDERDQVGDQLTMGGVIVDLVDTHHLADGELAPSAPTANAARICRLEPVESSRISACTSSPSLRSQPAPSRNTLRCWDRSARGHAAPPRSRAGGTCSRTATPAR